MVTASGFVPLWDRAAEWARRLAMIGQARSFLYLSTYYVEHDAYGRELLDALLEAARRGVAVRLLIDGVGQHLGGALMSRADQSALGAKLAELRRARAVVTLYRPPHRMQRWLGGGQHVKIQVSEAGEAIFGSSNVTRSSFEGWNEYSVALRGPVVRTLLESFADIGGAVDDAHVRELERACETGGDLALEYWLCNPNLLQGPMGPLGWRGPNVVTTRLIERIASARRSIALTSFYFKPAGSLAAALLAAAERGVQIEVHHSHRDALPASELPWIAAAARYGAFLRAGVRIYENRRGEHSKIVLVDERRVAFGSYNFEYAAHDRLAEAMLASDDPRAVDPAKAIFAELRENANDVRVTPGGLLDLPARLRTKRAILRPLRRWM